MRFSPCAVHQVNTFGKRTLARQPSSDRWDALPFLLGVEFEHVRSHIGMPLTELVDSLCDHIFQYNGIDLPAPPMSFPRAIAVDINTAKWLRFAAIPATDRHAFPAATNDHIHFNHYPFVQERTLGHRPYLADPVASHVSAVESPITESTEFLLRFASGNVLTLGHCRETGSGVTPGRVG